MSPIIPVFVALTLVSLSGCTRKTQPSPLEEIQQQQSPALLVQNPSQTPQATPDAESTPSSATAANAVEPFKLSDNYQGANLTLAYPSSVNWGAIILEGEDARALYQALRIQPESLGGEANWLPDQVKRGNRVECVKRMRDESNSVHVCTFQLDYRAGRVLPVPQPASVDASAPDSASTYRGTRLTLEGDGARSATLTLDGDDARALYHVLSAEAEVSTPVEGPYSQISSKTTEDLRCSQSIRRADPAQVDRLCEFRFSYRTGARL